MPVPILETERLVLRAHALADFDALAAMWAEPAVVRFIGGQPSTPAESWSRLLRYAGLWPLLGFGYWAVELKASGHYIGDVGFADWRRDITPTLAGVPESGWAFSAAAHGRGIATEALQAALAWADRNLAGQPSGCIISLDNLASIRVAHKCAYAEVARSEFRGAPVIHFRR